LEHFFEAGNFALEMLGASGGKFVDADAAVRGGDAPFGFDQFFFEEALESGIERALFDLEKVVGDALDVLDEGVAVQRLSLQSAENHHFERTRKEVALLRFFHGGLP
jgi:hypothetical protein